MARLQLHTFTKADIPAASQLLAERHRLARAGQPWLPASWEQPEPWDAVLAPMVGTADGVTVTDGGRMAGFMLGRKELPPQESMMARWGVPRGVSIGIEGHAASLASDVLAIYTEMYASLAEEWVREGFFAHTATVLAGDRAAHDALVALGFGRRVVVGVRQVEPVPPPPESSDVYIRLATSEDAEAVHLLELELDYWHSHSPMFLPVDAATNASAWEFMKSVMSSDRSAVFLGFQEDEPVGMISMLPDGFVQGCLRGDSQVYLYQGIVNKDVRSGGVGEALLSRALTWAKEQGFTSVSLHYFSANPAGGPFWRKHGFEAASYGMQRIVDERIAWARDWR
jgi:GNAT superfamily N-acetyltransferase